MAVRSRRRVAVLAVSIVVLASLARAALAHEFSPAYLGLSETATGRFTAQWKVSLTGGLADTLTPQLPAACTFSGELRSRAMGDARIQERDLVCDADLAGLELSIAGLPVTMTDVLLRVDYLDGGAFTRLLTPAAPSTVIEARQTAAAVAGTYLSLGVEHILLGIDHLLFVFALLMLVGGVRRLVVTVTAFTLAHSLTLAVATLELVHVPQAPVEAVIALSILFLAAELGRQALVPGVKRDIALEFPWLVAFVFGLLHGFGFAGALAEVGLPARAVPLALLFFNVGVELGQLIFVFVVLSLAWAWRSLRLPAPRLWRAVAAYGLGSVAAFWVIERTVGAV